jgi:hypothetical protein
MSKRAFGPLDLLLHRAAMRRWRRIAARADTLGLDQLRRLRGRAQDLRRTADRLLFVTDGPLAQPRGDAGAIPKPLHADWAWRPTLWCGPISPPGRAAVESRTTFGDEVTVFHDCDISELTIRQLRNTREDDLAPFGLRMDVFRFDGSFLSLVIELPANAMEGLGRRHLLRVNAVVETEKPLRIFARLNIRHGPNTEQMVRELPLADSDLAVDFDLAYTKLNEKRVERAWLDLIFEGPEMNQVMLRDMNFSRRPRAEV